jgi:hypothetical protein
LLKYTVTIKVNFNKPLIPSPNAYAYERVDLPYGFYALTQVEEGAASGEVN